MTDATTHAEKMKLQQAAHRKRVPGICDYADLVSEMRAVKHPFDAGIKAVRGIDF